MGAMMGIGMGFFMSLIVTYLNLGFVDNFFQMWARAFFISFPIGFPIALIIMPFVKKIVDKITK